MNPTDFSQLPLRDIHLPGPIGWWPPAPGWWLLLGLLLTALAAYGVFYYLARHRRVALKSLARVRLALEQGAEPVDCLQHVSTLLRRFAMTTAARQSEGERIDVAGLIGDRWLGYLDSRWQRAAFAEAVGRRLLEAPYSPPNSVARQDALELATLAMDWLRAQPAVGRARRAARS